MKKDVLVKVFKNSSWNLIKKTCDVKKVKPNQGNQEKDKQTADEVVV